MAEKKKYNSILISGRKDQTLTYSKYVKDEESGESVKESLDKKVNVTDELTTQQIKDGAITNEKMAADSVGNTNLQDGSVSNKKLEDGSITNEKLAENSITKDKLQDKTIGVEKLDNELRQTIAAATGLPEDLVETIQNVDDTLKDHQSQLDDKQSQIDDKQQQITANDEDISLLQTRSTQMEETIKGIAATGGASQATAVTYNNEKSKLTAVNIQSAVDEVVDKTAIKDEEGNVQDTPFRVIENEEFIMAVVDSENRLLFGIYRATGKPYFPLNEMYHVEQNEEFFAVWLDAANHVLLGIRRDGEIIGEIHAVNALKQVVSQLQSDLASLQEKVGTIDTNLKELLGIFSLQDNEEYLAVEQDAEGKVLSATNLDGSHYIYNAKSETIPEEFSHIEDPEGRMEITTDAENKILGYRDSEGTRHEKSLNVENIQLGAQAAIYINKQTATKIRDFDLPKYGSISIREEMFFLTSNAGYKDENGIYAITINDDTDSNAQKGLPIQKFYVKSSLKDNGNGSFSVQEGSIPLDFYVPSKVKEVDGKYYVLSSLSELDGVFSVTTSSIEVTKIIDKPTIGTWTVDKKTEHWCKVDIDFGYYLKGTFNIGIKYQGASTLYVRKRNFRFTFYTDSNFSKKDKKKIGEMIRTNSFNLKANYNDATRLKEAALYRIFIAMWENRRREYHNYPWRNSSTYYDCAVGMIKGFPINLSIGDDFFGIYIYGLKKDEKNYRLSDDSEGMFVSGDRSDSQCWIDGKPSDWSDEMNDEMTQSNIEALTKFLAFVNSADFTKENVPTHLSVIDWIDYFIGMQVFVLKDSNCRNMILYSGSDKTLIYPFFYDLDNSFLFGIKDDIIETAWASDTSIWKKFISIYWDEIVTRYKELRENILTIEYVKKVFVSLEENIPVGDYSQESKKWGYASTNRISLILYNFSKRLEWLDNNYFV